MIYAIFNQDGTAKAYYDTDINGDNIPGNAVEITKEQHNELLSNPDTRRWDAENSVVVEYVHVHTDDELAAAARTKRDSLLRQFDTELYCNELRWSEYTADQQAVLIAYRQALKDVPEQEGFPASIEWPVLNI